jgi:hypothetical protein
MQFLLPRSLFWAAVGLCVTAAPAQSCLTTVLGGNTSTSSGCAALFDMTITSSILVQSIDCNMTAGVGTPLTLDVWVTPNTWIGNHTNQSVWTLVGSAAANSGGAAMTTFTFTSPFLLNAGSYGVSLVPSTNTSHRYTGGVQTQTFSDAVMSLTLGAIQATPWVSATPLNPRHWNGTICYTPASGFAQATPYGRGCYDRFASFYETFPNGTFDLSNTSLTLFPTGNGYLVLPIGSGWHTPTSANLALTDDSVSAALPLGFSLPIPGGTVSDVYVSSNGLVYGGGAGPNGCCAGSSAILLTSFPCWAPNHGDLNPGVGGTVHFDVDPANQAAYVTFLGVPEYGTTNLNTFQVAFFANGNVEYRFQSCLQANRVSLTGWSPGGNARDPGSVDLSAAVTLQTVPDALPLTHRASARPTLGTSINLLTTELPAGTVLGVTLMGFGEITGGLDLSALGMPGCSQYLSLDASLVWVPVSGVGSSPFALPSAQAFAGLQVRSQGIALVPGINAANVISSNGLRMTLDVN